MISRRYNICTYSLYIGSTTTGSDSTKGRRELEKFVAPNLSNLNTNHIKPSIPLFSPLSGSMVRSSDSDLEATENAYFARRELLRGP